MTSLPLRASTPPTPLSGSYPGTGFRRRTLGRAASPPTWAYYEQIPVPGGDDDSSGSSSEDDDVHNGDSHSDDDEQHEHDDDDGFEMDFEGIPPPVTVTVTDTMDAMEVDESASAPSAHVPPECPDGGDDEEAANKANAEAIARKIAKGKERAVDPPSVVAAQEQRKRERERKTRRKRHSEPAYRPILTIHRSQGFVWNQDLFVPSYIKDRYVTSTSPPGESCISLNNTSTPNPYDAVEVVEIRVTGQELNDVIP